MDQQDLGILLLLQMGDEVKKYILDQGQDYPVKQNYRPDHTIPPGRAQESQDTKQIQMQNADTENTKKSTEVAEEV